MTGAQKFIEGLDLTTDEGCEAAEAELKRLMAVGDRESFNELYDLLFGESDV